MRRNTSKYNTNTNFKEDQALCQVIFSCDGHNSHMCPKSAAEKMPDQYIPDYYFFLILGY